MAKRSKRRRQPQSRNTEQQQHRRSTRNGEAEGSSSAPQPERTLGVLQEAASQAAAQLARRTNPFESMERFMQTAFMPFSWFSPWSAVPPAPKLDVIDRENLVVVRAEVPGVRKDRLEVEASGAYVKIKGTIEHDEERQDEHYRIAETSRGAFERTVHLPTEVDSTKARASFKDGVVEIMLPKVDRSRPHQLKLTS